MTLRTNWTIWKCSAHHLVGAHHVIVRLEIVTTLETILMNLFYLHNNLDSDKGIMFADLSSMQQMKTAIVFQILLRYCDGGQILRDPRV